MLHSIRTRLQHAANEHTRDVAPHLDAGAPAQLFREYRITWLSTGGFEWRGPNTRPSTSTGSGGLRRLSRRPGRGPVTQPTEGSLPYFAAVRPASRLFRGSRKGP